MGVAGCCLVAWRVEVISRREVGGERANGGSEVDPGLMVDGAMTMLTRLHPANV